MSKEEELKTIAQNLKDLSEEFANLAGQYLTQTSNTNKAILRQDLINKLLQINTEALQGAKFLGKRQRKTKYEYEMVDEEPQREINETKVPHEGKYRGTVKTKNLTLPAVFNIEEVQRSEKSIFKYEVWGKINFTLTSGEEINVKTKQILNFNNLSYRFSFSANKEKYTFVGYF